MKCFVFFKLSLSKRKQSWLIISLLFLHICWLQMTQSPWLMSLCDASAIRLSTNRKADVSLRSPKSLNALWKIRKIMKNEMFWLWINLRKSYCLLLRYSTDIARSVVVALWHIALKELCVRIFYSFVSISFPSTIKTIRLYIFLLPWRLVTP